MSDNRFILYGVLNWGLGHATRSVPLIRALLKEGYTPVLCSDGAALEYLRREFPELPVENLPPYNIRYDRSGVVRAVLLRIPALYRSIRDEHKAVGTLEKKYEPVGLISDNRLGFHCSDLPAAYITHQLHMALPFYLTPANFIHKSYIKKFDECWVPDFADNFMAGKLSTESQSPVPVRYLGPLSRFREPQENNPEKVYDAVAILSGPEPQRSLLEQKIISEFERLSGRFAMVRGVASKPVFSNSVEIYGLLQEKEVSRILRRAEVVVSRSGYSSLMDYYFLQCKACLIPTPGQPEQEYLARYHSARGYFHYRIQKSINLEEDLKKAAECKSLNPSGKVLPDFRGLFSLFERK